MRRVQSATRWTLRKTGRTWLYGCIVLVGIFISGSATPVTGEVKAYEEEITIPTYITEEPDPNPMFYTGIAYQGAQKRIYPYPLDNNLTDRKVDKKWTGLVLENEYIKVVILPERGGKLYIGRDRTNGYDFIYHNAVIKPGLVGMLGAWTSGGIEWNIPHHHRATADLPVNYRLTDNPDGSKTIWVGEVERRHRSRWGVAVTLHPGTAYIEATMRYYNRTALANSILMWANTGVHSNEDYQIIFPPQTEYATFHGKNQFSEWPISHQMYNDIDFTEGVDISWFKNHKKSVSFFAWDSTSKFIAGYDHGKDAGTVVITNPYTAPGKKFWNWGVGPRGEMWFDLLTDNSGPYVELMTGAYSDNQPDYSWANPHTVKPTTMYFYSIKKMGDVKYADRNGALNLEQRSDDTYLVAVNTTRDFKNAQLRVFTDMKNLLETELDIGPAGFYRQELTVDPAIKKTDITVELFTADGKQLLQYQPEPKKGAPMPNPVTPPKRPEEVETVEQLYQRGVRLQQFYNPNFQPYPYYREALRRDPNHSGANTQIGLLYLKRGMYDSAAVALQRAYSRITKNYTTPKDAEPLYYYGLTLLKQDKLSEAYDWLYDATWDYEWYAPAHGLLARIKSIQGDYATALEHTEKSLANNTRSFRVRNLQATLLRKTGKLDEAEQIIRETLNEAPLNFRTQYELMRLYQEQGKTAEYRTAHEALAKLMREEVQNYLTLANEYGKAGFYDEGIHALNLAVESAYDTLSTYPLVYYYLGYYHEQLQDLQTAKKYYRQGHRQSPRYCFPYRYETARVLKAALKHLPGDDRAYYYLGNLYYDQQPEQAMEYWQSSLKYNDGYARVHRNLAFGYHHTYNKEQKAVRHMLQAIELNPEDPRFYLELDKYSEYAGISPEKRMQRLEEHPEVIEKSLGALARKAELMVFHGEYDRAINILETTHFRRAEGAGGIHDVWVDAHLLRGQQRVNDGKYQQAIADFHEALRYPINLEVPTGNRERQVHYYLGMAYDRMGKRQQAREHYRKATSEPYGWSEMQYAQALAYEELGQKAKADSMFSVLINQGRTELTTEEVARYFAKFGGGEFEKGEQSRAHYLIGLGYLGKEEAKEARKQFQDALSLNPANLGAKVHLDKWE